MVFNLPIDLIVHIKHCAGVPITVSDSIETGADSGKIKIQLNPIQSSLRSDGTPYKDRFLTVIEFDSSFLTLS